MKTYSSKEEGARRLPSAQLYPFKEGMTLRVKQIEDTAASRPLQSSRTSWTRLLELASLTTENKKATKTERKTVQLWLKLENAILVYREDQGEESRLDLNEADIHADVERYEVETDLHQGIALCLVLTAPLEEEEQDTLRLSFSNLDELHQWWKALVLSRQMAKSASHCTQKKLATIHTAEEEDGPPLLSLEESHRVHDDKPKKAASENELLNKASLFASVFDGAFDEVLRCVIRPPRSEYRLSALGPDVFPFYDFTVTRTDFTIRNKRDQCLVCSRWLPRIPGRRCSSLQESLSTVVYIHGNASSRLEALTPALATCLSIGVSLVAIDTAGSGLSDGDHVTLGYFEQEDLAAVVDHLRLKFDVQRVGLWGRSMGAATCLLYASRLSPNIACLVSDSSYSSLHKLCLERIQRALATTLPLSTFDAAVNRLAKRVQQCAGFCIKDVEPALSVATCATPALLIHGRRDELVGFDHATTLIDNFDASTDVQLLVEPRGSHTSARSSRTVNATRHFLRRHLGSQSFETADNDPRMTIKAPMPRSTSHDTNLSTISSSQSISQDETFKFFSQQSSSFSLDGDDDSSYFAYEANPSFSLFCGDEDVDYDDSRLLPMDDVAFTSKSVNSYPWSSVWRHTPSTSHIIPAPASPRRPTLIYGPTVQEATTSTHHLQPSSAALSIIFAAGNIEDQVQLK